MIGLVHVGVVIAVPIAGEPIDLHACARVVGASVIATRLAQLPPSIHEVLVRRVEAAGDMLAENGTPLRDTDAPTRAERQHVGARFEGGLFAGGRWFVQVKQGQVAGVLTYAFFPDANGRFRYLPRHDFRGPPCASIQAALAGVTSVPGL